MEFQYYYGNQADQFSFIRIPRMLLVDPMFSPLSLQSKMLYGVLLDRMGLSMRNGWYDELNRVYIIYQISEIQEDLGFSKKKAIDYLTELEKFGLVEKKRRGRGLPSILYIKSFLSGIDAARGDGNGTSAPRGYETRSVETDTSRGAEIALQEVPKSTLQEVPKSTPLKSNNNIIKTYSSEILSNHILSADAGDKRGCDERSTCSLREKIRERMEYDMLSQQYPYDTELLDGIMDIMLEVELNQSQSMQIASAAYPTELVRSRFARLTAEHIRYVIDCFNANTTRIGNIKKYLMTALFNAPSTISGYYTAAVHHDMPYLAR